MKRFFSLATVLLLVLSLAGCGTGSSGTVSNQTTSNDIKVGVLLPLTGSSAEMGKLAKNGIEMAINSINTGGGIKSLNGAKITPVYADSTGKPEVGATGIERLIVKDKVNFSWDHTTAM